MCCLGIPSILPVSGQEVPTPDAETLLAGSIAYHDPNGVWDTFQGAFVVLMESPGNPMRRSEIHLDQPAGRFRLEVRQGNTEKTYQWNAGACSLSFNGKTEFSEAVAKEHRLTCERARMYRDYYTYLYGLPMKLRDPGTRISPKVEKRRFHGKEYWVLEVRYDPEVGKDLWYFYFNPQTYALEAYQFYHDKPKNDGEYILLEGEYPLGGMRLPAVRTWYTNREGKLLGTDTLKNL